MKRRSLLFLALPVMMAACNNEAKDSVDKADSTNEAKMDTSNTTGPTIAVDASTSETMVRLADAGMTEVQLGQLAQQKGNNQRVKDFGAMMVKDHSAANDELKGLSGQKNVTLPSTVGSDHQTKIDDLNKKSGKDFDKAYMDAMVDGHQKVEDDLEKLSNDSKDADIKAWADKTLPVVRHHLEEAKAIQKALK